MLIEKFARFEASPLNVFQTLKNSLQGEGFEMFDVEENTQEIRCFGFVYHRVRIDLLAQCFDLSGYTLVQIIYSPLLSPPSARPFRLSTSAQERVLNETDQKIISVFNKTGEWVRASREDLDDETLELKDPRSVVYRRRRGKRWVQLLIGLIITLLGSLMSYLHLNQILRFGSTNFWLILAVLGVAVFCFGLFNMVWRR